MNKKHEYYLLSKTHGANFLTLLITTIVASVISFFWFGMVVAVCLFVLGSVATGGELENFIKTTDEYARLAKQEKKVL